MNFSSLGLSKPILKALTQQGYDSPSAIQIKVIPTILKGKDVMAAAHTGTGKTAGYTLPILERLSMNKLNNPRQIRVLILTPTRELAAQVQVNVTSYARHLPIKSTAAFGGVKISPQKQKLRNGIDILVATPGRLLDLFNQKSVKFDQLEVLVMDEADRMLDMGFIHDIRNILGLLPAKRQNLMFSATFSKEIRKLANGLMNNPVEISACADNTAVKTVKHWIALVEKRHKSALLLQLIRGKNWNQVLVFVRTKHGADRLTRKLEKQGIKAAAIHGNKRQGTRTRTLSNFKSGKIAILVATDIAARGLDIHQLPQVVNFDLPDVAQDYVHRIGRTGRAGEKGEAISLVSPDESAKLTAIENLLKYKLDRNTVTGLETKHRLSESSINRKRVHHTKRHLVKKFKKNSSSRYNPNQQQPALA